jgi:Tfp pilus assembly protein PilX
MNHRAANPEPGSQAGISLLVVLVALVVIGFAAIALLRSSDTSTLISGNLAFQKTALASADAASEAAINRLVAMSGGTTLFDDDPTEGYYATSADLCDLTGSRTPDDASDDVNWDGADPGSNCNMDALAVTPAGVAPDFDVGYVINRMCNATGSPNALFAPDGVTPMACSSYAAGASEDSTRIGASYGNVPLTGVAQTYYRITVRVRGPRNTVRYAQAMVVL